MKTVYIPYVIVFDMDETLGHFEELSIFCETLQLYFKKQLTQTEFFDIIDLFNKFLRPKILNILEYLKKKKDLKICDKIIIYSNNPNHKWCTNISNYFNTKLDYNLFDQIIVAWKHKGKIIESNRSRYDKSVEDLLNCTKLSRNSKIFFLDDIEHPLMQHQNVVYLKIKPYKFCYSYENMIDKYYNLNKNLISDKNNFKNFMLYHMNKYNYNINIKPTLEQKVDSVLTKKLLEHLESFFADRKQKNFTI